LERRQQRVIVKRLQPHQKHTGTATTHQHVPFVRNQEIIKGTYITKYAMAFINKDK
jgi:hypothetical protein